MTQPPYQIEIVADERRLSGLKAEWDALYDRQAAPHLSDSFDWAWLSWTAVTSGRRRRPFCIVVRRDDRTVALWPLVITNSVETRPLTVGLAIFGAPESGVDWAVISAGTLMAVAPLLVAFMLFQRQFMQSFMQAGIK